MKPELFWLVLTATMTGALWIPYIIDRGRRNGFPRAFQTPLMSQAPVEAEWAQRAKRAHENGVENLAVFAPLVIATQLAGVSNSITATAAAVYFWCRLIHYLVLTLAIPYVRTFIWTVGWCAMMAIAWQLLAHA